MIFLAIYVISAIGAWFMVRRQLIKDNEKPEPICLALVLAPLINTMAVFVFAWEMYDMRNLFSRLLLWFFWCKK